MIRSIEKSLVYLFIVSWYAMCVVGCIDSTLFVSPILSKMLLANGCKVVMLLILLTHIVVSRRKIDVTPSCLLILSWTIYVILHGVFVGVENYIQLSFVLFLLFPLVICQALKTNLFSKRHIYNGVFLIVTIQIVWLFGQVVGFIDSNDSLYRLTGTSYNPNVTALCIMLSLPFLYIRFKDSSHVFVSLCVIVLSLVFVMVLKCRTAYIGLLCMLVCGIVQRYHVQLRCKYGSLSKVKKTLGWLLVICLILSFFWWMFIFKQDSSEGRMFIWKRVASALVDNPLGSGYGLFQRNYNLFQIDYFANNHNEFMNSQITHSIWTSYNDYLEHSFQGGIISGVLLLVFYVMLTISAFRKKSFFFPVLVAIVVMSCVNFITNTTLPSMFVSIIVALVLEKECGSVRFKPVLTRGYVFLVSSVVVGYVTYNISMQTYSQYEFCKIQNQYEKDGCLNENRLENISCTIGTSELFWSFCGDYYYGQNKIARAIVCYEEALKYVSDPTDYISLAKCYEVIGDRRKSLFYSELAYYAVPQSYQIKYLLMDRYIRYGMKMQAYKVAMDIIEKDVKIESPIVDRIKSKANEYIHDCDK